MTTYLKMAPRLGIAYIPTRELESSRAVEREEEVSRSEESLFKVVLLPADSSNDMVMAKVERHSMVLSSMQRQNYGAVSNANFRLVQRQNHGAASRDIARIMALYRTQISVLYSAKIRALHLLDGGKFSLQRGTYDEM